MDVGLRPTWKSGAKFGQHWKKLRGSSSVAGLKNVNTEEAEHARGVSSNAQHPGFERQVRLALVLAVGEGEKEAKPSKPRERLFENRVGGELREQEWGAEAMGNIVAARALSAL